MAKTKQKAWRFYRSNLSTIVWDGKAECPLADFSPGHFTTDNPKVARKLKEIGYPEIPIDATEPPAEIIVRQPAQTIDGDVPVIGALMNEKISPTATQEKAVEQSLMKKTHSTGGPPQLRDKKKSNGMTKLPRRRKKKNT